uniref:Uncharacterized protein n=1 Tax=Odontella aurita TaxID=265563 RepID=A0A7S4HVK0_9STRA|mmetsp:Transcript_15880/g.45635  ORF Transcript_15880/g.45635 Transcript_15880/m.45635 type:complete len:411 (+) Transcript_15880:113-1345(+)
MAAATEDVVMPPPDEGGSTPTRSRTPARVRARRRRPTLPALATAALLLVCASLDPSGRGAGYPAAGSVLPIFALAANPSSAPAPSIAGGGEDEGHVAAPAPVVARLGRKLGVRYRPTSHSASAASIPRGGAGDRGKAPSSSSSDKTLSEILGHAVHRGLGGGLPGAVAGIVQVLTLMWLRTVINYQCRYGTTFLQSLTTLYNQGGVPRFYRGMAFALVQAPLARFASTAANDGVEALLGNLEYTKNWGPGKGTVVASAVVGLWRMMLMPVDTCKTVLQVDSAEGFRNLIRGVRRGKVWLLYQGKSRGLFWRGHLEDVKHFISPAYIIQRTSLDMHGCFCGASSLIGHCTSCPVWFQCRHHLHPDSTANAVVKWRGQYCAYIAKCFGCPRDFTIWYTACTRYLCQPPKWTQ